PPPPPAPTTPTANLSVSPTAVTSGGGTVTFTLGSTNGFSCTLASTPAMWSGANPTSANCNGTATVQVPATTVARSWTVTFTVTSSDAQTASALAVVAQQAPSGGGGGGGTGGGGFQQSPNWSGYIVPSSSIVTEAGGSWTVPLLNCAVTPNAAVSVWAGIG